MKLFSAHLPLLEPSCAEGRRPRRGEAAFTMVEIAISLAIIGFALVAIIGVLPSALQVQRENREETIINQDASVFMDALRSGARGMDDLTNYVFAITNFFTLYDPRTNVVRTSYDGYDFLNSVQDGALTGFRLTNGLHIVGLLGTPKYIPIARPAGSFRSNHIVAFVRALSGAAVEKFPQTNATVRESAFSYRLITEVVPLPTPAGGTPAGKQLTNNLHEVRLAFRWPLLPNFGAGNGRLAFRTINGGQLLTTNDPVVPNQPLYFFEPRAYVKAP